MNALARLYSRRVVNVNVNIIVAGLVAIALTVIVVELFHTFWLGEKEELSHQEKLLITLVTFTADLIFDVAVYFVLHWIANHSQFFRGVRGPGAHPAFFADATWVQFERAALSPLLYGTALGLQYLLMVLDYSPAFATAVGFLAGMAVARTLHTLWMIRMGRT